MASFDKVLESYRRVLSADGNHFNVGTPRYTRYAVTNLRGGVGKTSIAFNMAFELSRVKSVLVVDMCPQCNLTESLMRAERPSATIQSLLQPKVLGPAFGDAPDDVEYKLSDVCSSFRGGKKGYLIPGSAELFAFPSALYGQLQLASVQSADARTRVGKLLHSLRDLMDERAKERGCELVLMDTSPFYAGGTHLAWCAAQALIVPVRVDEHSIESLKLTFRMLADKSGDFWLWNSRAGVENGPKIAAIVMTMVGAKGQEAATPDGASRMFIERALVAAAAYPQLFDVNDPADAFIIADDFRSSGRISGVKSIPIAKLSSGQFHRVDGKRLQVNKSVERYQRQLKHLASII